MKELNVNALRKELSESDNEVFNRFVFSLDNMVFKVYGMSWNDITRRYE